MKTRKHLIYCLVLFSTLSFSSPVLSEIPIQLNVRVILASGNTGDIDPRLKSLIKELETIFRYSSYQLLDQSKLSLTSNRAGRVYLPGNRMMNIISRGVSDDRVTLDLEILKDNNRIFKTVIRLRNKSSITIGGPEYQGGNLLFNIFTSF